MKEKTALVTGATSGIGEAIAEGLAKRGAKTLLVSRSEDKCRSVAERLRQITGNERVSYYVADLSSRADVNRLTAQLNNELGRLDVLINNAGAWFKERQESADGVEMTWALNHLGYFSLTHGLTELLRRTASEYGEARVINQSSLSHKQEGEMHWDDLEFHNWSEAKGTFGNGWGAYSQSKLANVLHAFALARKLEGTGVTANAVHPGVVVTGFTQNNGLLYKTVAPLRRLFNRSTPADGAAPALYLATAPEAAGITGVYYGPPQEREVPNPVVEDEAAQERLWDLSLQQLKLGRLPVKA